MGEVPQLVKEEGFALVAPEERERMGEGVEDLWMVHHLGKM